MIKLFRYKLKDDAQSHPGAEKAATIIMRGLWHVQTKCASWLNAREKKLTLKQKQYSLFAFCIGMGFLAMLFLYRGLLVRSQMSPAWLTPPVVTLPEDTRLPDSLNLEYLRELYKQKKIQRQNDSLKSLN